MRCFASKHDTGAQWLSIFRDPSKRHTSQRNKPIIQHHKRAIASPACPASENEAPLAHHRTAVYAPSSNAHPARTVFPYLGAIECGLTCPMSSYIAIRILAAPNVCCTQGTQQNAESDQPLQVEGISKVRPISGLPSVQPAVQHRLQSGDVVG